MIACKFIFMSIAFLWPPTFLTLLQIAMILLLLAALGAKTVGLRP